MPVVDTDLGPLGYEVCDIVAPWVREPETIVFHHGIAANRHLWSRWLPVLVPHYRLLRFDMRGFGESVPVSERVDWSIDRLVDDLGAVADDAGLQRFHLVGESIGGTAALGYASRHPGRVASLTLSNAAASGTGVTNVRRWEALVESEGQSGWAERMMHWRFHPGGLDDAAWRWFDDVHQQCDIEVTLALANALLGVDLTPALADLEMPVLLLSPDASPFIGVGEMVALGAAIPDARLQVFAHSRHGLPLSHGRAAAETLLQFLRDRFGGAP